jgi:hypothetical protein
VTKRKNLFGLNDQYSIIDSELAYDLLVVKRAGTQFDVIFSGSPSFTQVLHEKSLSKITFSIPFTGTVSDPAAPTDIPIWERVFTLIKTS